MWCLLKGISIKAQHLPGILNAVADAESQEMIDCSEWKLNPDIIFKRIEQIWGPVEVDLFASRLTAQYPVYFSWRPDPYVAATDAFLQVWTSLKGFVNPPWNLLGRVLTQTQARQARLILIIPVWKTQPWYPTLLAMTGGAYTEYHHIFMSHRTHL